MHAKRRRTGAGRSRISQELKGVLMLTQKLGLIPHGDLPHLFLELLETIPNSIPHQKYVGLYRETGMWRDGLAETAFRGGTPS